MTGWRAGLLTALCVGFLAAGPGPGEAQSGGPGSPPDTVQVDSTRLRVMNRLQALARGPVSDSLVALADSLIAVGDTLSLPEELRPRDAERRGPPPRSPPRDASTENMERFLASLPGYTLTEYDAQGADFDAVQRRLLLNAGESQPAEVRRDGIVLVADSSITYDEAAGRIRAEGDTVTLTPPEGSDPVTSDLLVYDLEAQRGSALGAVTRYRESGNWTIRGDLPYLADGTAYAHDARFTSCDLEEPHYHFETDELKIVNNKVLVARPVRLYFADVPVAWLPFVAQSLSEGRASGLLTPRFSVNDIARTSAGYDRRISNVGFYWAINDYMDASLALDWWSNNYTGVQGTYRYSWREKFVQGGLNFRRFWRVEGGQELALDTRHSWEPNERTQVRVSARYASSLDFVRQNTFDPREVTQSIDSELGANRRFDWGTMAISGNRRQYLSDDRVETTFPQLTLSLQPITIFPASGMSARWYNNWAWNGSANFSRRTIDRPPLPDSVAQFSTGLFDQANNTAGMSSSFTLGAVQWSQNFNVQQGVVKDFPIFPDSLMASAQAMALERNRLSPARAAAALDGATLQDLARTTVTWGTTLSYQQRLIGTTTFTPRLSIDGNLIRDDQIDAAADQFVAAPSRVNFGADLKADLYGFFPGFGRYSALRHRISPTFGYTYSPAVTPSQLQQDVFNSRDLRAQNQLRISLNQTFEGKVAQAEDSTAAAAGSGPAGGSGSDPGGPRRLQKAEVVNLLSIRTSAITYDFQRADSLGNWTRGLAENLTISNAITSDFLRGLTIQVEHDIFDTSVPTEPAEGLNFSPFLSRANLSFSMGSRSEFFQWLARIAGGNPDPAGVLRPEDRDQALAEEEANLEDPVQDPDPSQVMPGIGDQGFAGSTTANRRRRGQRGGSVGSWNANFSYSLVRPRNPDLQAQQMLQMNFQLKPTQQWDLSWQTAFDLEAGRFNDHVLRLTRDLHRWEAAFDFRQTATGNWTFQFEVSLLDNRDLKFDYRQQDLVEGAGFR